MKREPVAQSDSALKKIAPTPEAIRAAELRVLQSAQNVRDGLQRLRVAYRTSMTRPLTLVKAAGLAALFSFLLTRRVRSPRPGKGWWAVILLSLRGLLLSNIVRYGQQRLSNVFR